jgi:hypothetical protein
VYEIIGEKRLNDRMPPLAVFVKTVLLAGGERKNANVALDGHKKIKIAQLIADFSPSLAIVAINFSQSQLVACIDTSGFY